MNMPNQEEINTDTLPMVKKATISLYPNPTTDYFQVKGIEDTAQIIVSDLYCRVLIKKQILIDENISVSSLRNGVYIAKIITASSTVERKLVKG
jgi:hypothetical protein